jgi:hypothetical protein
VRLENDILLTESRAVDLSAEIPLEPEDVEAAMRAK